MIKYIEYFFSNHVLIIKDSDLTNLRILYFVHMGIKSLIINPKINLKEVISSFRTIIK